MTSSDFSVSRSRRSKSSLFGQGTGEEEGTGSWYSKSANIKNKEIVDGIDRAAARMNKYEIIGIVGEGAYGIVYKAKCKETGEFGKLPY